MPDTLSGTVGSGSSVGVVGSEAMRAAYCWSLWDICRRILLLKSGDMSAEGGGAWRAISGSLTMLLSRHELNTSRGTSRALAVDAAATPELEAPLRGGTATSSPRLWCGTKRAEIFSSTESSPSSPVNAVSALPSDLLSESLRPLACCWLDESSSMLKSASESLAGEYASREIWAAPNCFRAGTGALLSRRRFAASSAPDAEGRPGRPAASNRPCAVISLRGSGSPPER